VSRSVKELKHGGRVPPGPAFGAWETTTLRCPLHIITPRRRTIERCRIRDIPGPICQEWAWIVTRKLPIHSYPTFFLCFSRNTLKINRLGIIFSETKAKLEPLRSTILGKGRRESGPAFGTWETTTLRCPLHKITLRRCTIEGCRIKDLRGPTCQGCARSVPPNGTPHPPQPPGGIHPVHIFL